MPTDGQTTRLNTYYTRKANGQCVLCGKQTDRTLKGKTMCKECTEKMVENERYRRRLRARKGLCVNCGHPAEKRLCPECAEKERQYQKEVRERRKQWKQKPHTI